MCGQSREGATLRGLLTGSGPPLCAMPLRSRACPREGGGSTGSPTGVQSSRIAWQDQSSAARLRRLRFTARVSDGVRCSSPRPSGPPCCCGRTPAGRPPVRLPWGPRAVRNVSRRAGSNRPLFQGLSRRTWTLRVVPERTRWLRSYRPPDRSALPRGTVGTSPASSASTPGLPLVALYQRRTAREHPEMAGRRTGESRSV